MRNCIVGFSILLVTVLLGTGRAFAQESTSTLDIKAPPTGALSAEQLHAVATDIRRLEADPLASDAKEAREILFKWAMESPDISISICKGVVEGIVKSDSKYHGELLIHFILSSAAYVIENKDQADDKEKVNVAGLEGVINAYSVMKAQEGKSAKDKFVEKLMKMKEDGKLEEYVRKGLEEC